MHHSGLTMWILLLCMLCCTAARWRSMSCETRIVRVLGTLKYPGAGNLSAQSLLQNPGELARVVSWIEDQKVRGYPIDDRSSLRVAGPGWEEAFFSYLSKIECPYELHAGTKGNTGNLQRGLSWLVSKALTCEFEDRGKEYNAAARQLIVETSCVAGASSSPGEAPTSLPRIDIGDKETTMDTAKTTATAWSASFLSALEAACCALGVNLEIPSRPASSTPATSTASTAPPQAKNDDILVVNALEALLSAVQNRIAGGLETGGKGGTVAAMSSMGGASMEGDELADFAAGVCTGDEAVDRVATVLRMLFLLDLRGLQDDVNEMLALAQTIRASRAHCSVGNLKR